MTSIRRATIADVPEIMTIMAEAHDAMTDKSAYITDDRSYVTAHVDDMGFILLAEVDGQPAGFFMIELSGLDEHNPGHYLNFTEEQLYKTALMDSVAVRPKYQGHKIMQALIQKAISLLDEKYPYLFGTVAPDNYPSRRSFEACGFQRCLEIVKPQGQKRLLMMRISDTAKD